MLLPEAKISDQDFDHRAGQVPDDRDQSSIFALRALGARSRQQTYH